MNNKILLIDDTPDLLESLREYLEWEGFEVVTAVNGQEALVRLPEALPDLVITDLLMPVMDGFAFIETMLKEDRWKQIPIVIFSAKPEREVESWLAQHHKVHFLVKPCPLDKLVKLVQELIEK